MRLIEHLTQTLPNNCVSACLAMILGHTVERVTEEFHQDYHDKKKVPSDHLARYNINAYRHYAESVDGLSEDSVHVVTVPSLNIQHGLHQILVVEESNGVIHVLDPNVGREGRLAYYHWPLHPVWWRLDLTIHSSQVAQARIDAAGAQPGTDQWVQIMKAPMVSHEEPHAERSAS